MREQLSSTADTSDDSCSSERRLHLAGPRLQFSPVTRFGAVVLGCAALGAATCRHAQAQAQQNALIAPPSAQANSQSVSPNLFASLFSSEQPAASDLAAQLDALPATDAPVPIAFIPDTATTATSSVSASNSAAVRSPKPDIITTTTERRDSAIPFRRIYRMSRIAGLGETRTARAGSLGVLERTYRVTYRADVPVAYDYLGRRVVKDPVDMVIDAGYTDRAARALPSRSGLYVRAREIDMVATGYSPMEGSGTGRCANGMRAGYGVVAVDPRLIPLGSKLFVEGYGYALAGDTGGAIHGRRIDLGQNTYHAASAVGRRHVHVYVLSDASGR